MDITAAIDVAVGLALMYLVLSLLCTTINEFISSWLGLRAATLKAALEQLIDDPAVKALFDNHGLIDGTKVATGGGKMQSTLAPGAAARPAAAPPPNPSWLSKLSSTCDPSYLSGRSVALALISSADPNTPIPAIASLQAAVTALPDSNIRDTLLASLVGASADMSKVRDNLANWFDGAMERLSGAYKRYMQVISFAVGLVIAVAFNADTLNVGTVLWQDRSLSAAIAQSAPEIVKAACSNKACENNAPADGKAAMAPSAVVTQITAVENNLHGFPIGWTGPQTPCSLLSWVWKVLGLVLTACALVLGAPFWFDVLQKIMAIRATGDEPKKTNAT